jgi:hypothetical protein
LKRHERVTVDGVSSGYFAAVGGGEACQVWNLGVWVYR